MDNQKLTNRLTHSVRVNGDETHQPPLSVIAPPGQRITSAVIQGLRGLRLWRVQQFYIEQGKCGLVGQPVRLYVVAKANRGRAVR